MNQPLDSVEPSQLNIDTKSRINAAGQLLIRAAVQLHQIPPEELATIEEQTGDPLSHRMRTMLDALVKVDPTLKADVVVGLGANYLGD